MRSMLVGILGLAASSLIMACGATVVTDGEDEPLAEPECERPPPTRVGTRTPVLHYPFDEDTTNRGTLGAAFDAVGPGVLFSEGVLGGAARFGNSISVSLPGTGEVLSQLGEVTISFWIREPDGEALETAFFDCRSFDRGFHFYRGVYRDTAVTCWGTGHGSNDSGGCNDFTFAAGEWHHVLFQTPANGGRLEQWIDGYRAGTLSAEGFGVFGEGTSDIALHAPNIGDLRSTIAIQIDDLRIYDGLLNADERCQEIGGPWCPCIE